MKASWYCGIHGASGRLKCCSLAQPIATRLPEPHFAAPASTAEREAFEKRLREIPPRVPTLTELLDEVRVAARVLDHAHRQERIDELVQRAREHSSDFWYCWIHDSQEECSQNKCDLGHWESRAAAGPSVPRTLENQE